MLVTVLCCSSIPIRENFASTDLPPCTTPIFNL